MEGSLLRWFLALVFVAGIVLLCIYARGPAGELGREPEPPGSSGAPALAPAAVVAPVTV